MNEDILLKLEEVTQLCKEEMRKCPVGTIARERAAKTISLLFSAMDMAEPSASCTCEKCIGHRTKIEKVLDEVLGIR